MLAGFLPASTWRYLSNSSGFKNLATYVAALPLLLRLCRFAALLQEWDAADRSPTRDIFEILATYAKYAFRGPKKSEFWEDYSKDVKKCVHCIPPWTISTGGGTQMVDPFAL